MIIVNKAINIIHILVFFMLFQSTAGVMGLTFLFKVVLLFDLTFKESSLPYYFTHILEDVSWWIFIPFPKALVWSKCNDLEHNLNFVYWLIPLVQVCFENLVLFMQSWLREHYFLKMPKSFILSLDFGVIFKKKWSFGK